MSVFKLSLVSVLIAAPLCVLSHSCVDSSGSPVPWWVIYKLPSAGGNPTALGGYAFAYADENSPALEFQGLTTLNSSTNALQRTLKLGYAEENAYFYYNDDWPDDTGAPASRAHAKGIVTAAPDLTGSWMIHSTPRYPYRGETSFPEKARTYGQSFICVSIDNSTDWANIGKQLQIDNPSPYDVNLPSWFLDVAPAFSTIQDGPQPTNIPTYRSVPVGNGRFLSFAKDNSWYNDLYSKLVAPTLQVSLLAETWMRPKMASYCASPYSVMNVQTMNIGGVDFKETQDHSKVAFAAPGSREPYVCIGDINRMNSQKKRGGGTLCFLQASLWASFVKAVTSYDHCN